MGWQPIKTAKNSALVTVTDGEIVAPAINRYGDRWEFWEGEITDVNDQEYGVLNYWLDGFGPTHWWDFGEDQAMPPPPTGDT